MSKNNRVKVIEHHHYNKPNFGWNKDTAIKCGEAFSMGILGAAGTLAFNMLAQEYLERRAKKKQQKEQEGEQ